MAREPSIEAWKSSRGLLSIFSGSIMGEFYVRQPGVWLLSMAFALHIAAATASAQTGDPVEDLRRVLLTGTPLDENAAETLEFRRAKIKDAIDRMESIGPLRRALMLDEWKVDPGRVAGEKLRDNDIEMRKLLGQKLTRMLEAAARKGNPTARLAVANLIAEMGPTVRATDPVERGGFTRGLTPVVVQLTGDSDLGVRQEALRALGNINGPPKVVADVFKKTLQTDPAVGPRRLAADGLQQMIKVVAYLQKRGQTASGVEANRKDLLDTLESVAAALPAGQADVDAEVRMLALQAVQATGQAIAEFVDVPVGFARKNFPPVGRKLNPADLARILEAYEKAEQDFKTGKPVLDHLRQGVPSFARNLYDPDSRVRLAAIRAFENLGNAQLRMVRRAANLPVVIDPKEGTERSPRSLLEQVTFLQPFLDKDLGQVQSLLRDPDVRIRRSAAETLEVLEDKGLPALAGLIGALKDNDRFVRWTAAKTVGTLNPEQAAAAVSPLASLLADPELSIRIAAATSLEAMGRVAKDAIPALGQAARTGDVEARLAAMYALMKFDGATLRPIVSALVDAIGSTEPRIVRAAAETLAHIGPPASDALPALRRLLGHDDAEVRAWASEAILSILRESDL